MSPVPRVGQSTDYDYSFLAARQATLLPDELYFFYLLDRIRQARASICAAVFIIDIHPARGGEAAQRILDALAYACWLGLDVRVVVGRSAKTQSIDLMDQLSFRFLRTSSIPVRVARPVKRSSLHSKYVIIDQREVLVGSHNWAYFDLFHSRQTSVAIQSPHLARRLGRRFDELWSTSDEEYA